MSDLLGLLGDPVWREWWAWGVAAALFGVLELLAPGYIFLCFAAGAAAMAGLLLLGDPAAGWLPEGLPAHLLVFAVLSVMAWVVLRRLFRLPKGQVRVFRDDINED